MRRMIGATVLGIVALVFSGCGVSKSQYTVLEDEKKQLQIKTENLSRQVDELRRENQSLSDYAKSLKEENQRMAQERDRLRTQPKTTSAMEPMEGAEFK